MLLLIKGAEGTLKHQKNKQRFLQDPNNSARHASSCVASLPGVRMAGPPEVVFSLMQHHGAAQDAVRAHHSDLLVQDVHSSDPVLVKLDVTEVADVAVLVVGVAVVFLEIPIRILKSN